MKPIRRWFIQQKKDKIHKLEQRFQELAKKEMNILSREELDEYIRLDWQLKQVPSQLKDTMPTTLGNILRSVELRSSEKYGLDSVICWPRLWLLLPDNIKIELIEARANLNSNVRLWTWSLLFFVWSIWAWWIIPISIFSAYLSYRWMLITAIIYGDLVESAFDLYRVSLYKSLRWPLPKNPAGERQIGKEVTEYLWRGSEKNKPIFE